LAVLTSIDEEQARAIGREYGLGELIRFEGIPAGSVNSNFAVELTSGRYFFRIYEEQSKSGAVTEAAMLAHLAARGVATPAPLARRDGAYIGELSGKPAALFPWRDGRMRCQRSVTADDARRVGEALARVHAAGDGATLPAGRFRVEDLFARMDAIARAKQPELAAQAEPLRRALAEWSARRDPSLPRGLVHGDLFRDNVLWDARGGIAALLDFESASQGVFAYDVMVTVLAWCVGDALDPALVRAMIRGYESVRPFSTNEKSSLLTEGCVAALRFTTTRITDYAMREASGPRTIKDWRRFKARFDALVALGENGLMAMFR
jgi:homoserine kinase type II